MRTTKPLQWIADAEARQVLARALSEQPSRPEPEAERSDWRFRIRRWAARNASRREPPASELAVPALDALDR